MLTGDKMETAINIGYSSGLLGPEMVLIRLQDKGEGSVQLQRRLQSIVNIFTRLTQDASSMGKVRWFVLASAKQPTRSLGGWIDGPFFLILGVVFPSC